ncbi:MAG TPA: hypothetical protein VK601_07540 [Kofleriaceae bacterium]|nr:hypothetical protein [Kofleriaceae bacterium]
MREPGHEADRDRDREGDGDADADVDYFYLQRRLPDGRINMQARARALAHARLLRARLMATTGLDAAGIWQLRGPLNIGGRVTDVIGDPANANKFYVGSASGGVWKTTDGGATFTPIFDGQGTLAIGALALDPRDSNILYVGTGEANPGGGSVTQPGDGVWKTTDGGVTWQHLGLDLTVEIGRIVIDPKNPDNVFVAAMGNLFSHNVDRGVYRSQNAGATWTKVLFVSDAAGAIDLAIDPVNPNRVFAATWERLRTPAARLYFGPGSGLWRSTDGGTTWTALAGGLPSSSIQPSRIGVVVAPSSPSTVYAIYSRMDNSLEGVFRSTDSGTTWTKQTATNLASIIGAQAFWSGRLFVHPTNPNDLWADGVGLAHSTNGGASFSSVSGLHADQHAQWFFPANPAVILKGNDGGVYRSTNGGVNWTHFTNLPISQFYTVEAHQLEPAKIYGGLQDNGVQRTTTGQTNDWSSIVGGDGLEVHVDLRSTQVIYAESQFGALRRSTNGGSSFSNATSGLTGRLGWKTPIAIDPASTGTGTTSTLYLGSHLLFRSTNSAASWTAISGDLTNGNQGQGSVVFGTITTVAVAQSNKNTIYIGTDDGNVWITQNAGASYSRIDTSLPKLWVTRVAVDPGNDAIAYATFSGFRVDQPLAHVFRTTDHGATWTDISGDLPDAPVNAIAIDPRNSSTLFVGTDVGAFVSTNLGASWAPLGVGLPDAVVSDLKILAGPPATIYAATYGRSIYSMELPGAQATAVIDAHFDTDADGFAYTDDGFRGTAKPAYASGTRLATGGFTGGALQVSLGGIDDAVVTNMSGGWSRSFNLTQAGRVQLSLRVRLTQTSEYESNEQSQALVSIDGALVGTGLNDFVAQVVGDGNGGTPRTSGWLLVSLDLGTRSAGSHVVRLGGFNNQKTLNNESTEVLIDDVLLTVE